MIRLYSDPSHEALERLEICARRARAAIDAGDDLPTAVATCYRHREVKPSILAETAGKCAYCESKITHVYWGDVEHIKPKITFPELRLDYENLMLACAICNNNKDEYYSDDAPILHPYSDIPEDHLVGLGPFIWQRNASPVGERTIDLLDLNRDSLNERRLDRVKLISALATRYINEPDGPIKTILGEQIREAASDSAEFALSIRSFLLATFGLEWDSI